MIERQEIHLSPEFSCLYHGRSTFISFLKHAYNRGQFFIDGFLRPGTRFYLPLLGVLVLSIATVGLLLAYPLTALVWLGVSLGVFILGLFFGAIFFGVIVADAFALAALGVPFAIVYLAGLWRGVARKIVR
jgi:hypothetical protein